MHLRKVTETLETPIKAWIGWISVMSLDMIGCWWNIIKFTEIWCKLWIIQGIDRWKWKEFKFKPSYNLIFVKNINLQFPTNTSFFFGRCIVIYITTPQLGGFCWGGKLPTDAGFEPSMQGAIDRSMETIGDGLIRGPCFFLWKSMGLVYYPAEMKGWFLLYTSD